MKNRRVLRGICIFVVSVLFVLLITYAIEWIALKMEYRRFGSVPPREEWKKLIPADSYPIVLFVREGDENVPVIQRYHAMTAVMKGDGSEVQKMETVNIVILRSVSGRKQLMKLGDRAVHDLEANIQSRNPLYFSFIPDTGIDERVPVRVYPLKVDTLESLRGKYTVMGNYEGKKYMRVENTGADRPWRTIYYLATEDSIEFINEVQSNSSVVAKFSYFMMAVVLYGLLCVIYFVVIPERRRRFLV